MPRSNLKPKDLLPPPPAKGGKPPVPPSVRMLLEHIVENALLALDEIDGDPDLEPDADDEPNGDFEPSLGWTRSGENGDSRASDEEREDSQTTDESRGRAW